MMMTKVLNSDYTFVPGGSSSNFVLMEFTLPVAFNYTGKNLRLVIQSVSDTYKSYSFGFDSNIVGTVLTKKSDSYDSFLLRLCLLLTLYLLYNIYFESSTNG